MKTILRPALVLFVLLTIICCAVYPLAVSAISRIAFSDEADGSIVTKDGKAVGSLLIGQAFSSPQYFWSRPSATGPMPNNDEASSGSNLGPTNPAQIDAVKQRIAALKAADPTNTMLVPVDLVTASGSGVDPEISPAAAYYQASRVATARKMNLEQVRGLISRFTQGQALGFFGEARVNVLALNLALDQGSAPAAK
jgi:K+-transporting ATPase ATPase C chain